MKTKLLIFISITFLILTFGLGSWGVTESSEARYAEISKEMFDSGNYLEPTLLGIYHFHKPPITYYITTLGFKLFGTNEFGARFFLQVALILQILLVYYLGKNLFKSKKIGFTAASIYTSFPLVIISVRNLTTDAYLNTFILASLLSWITYRNTNKSFYLYLFYTFLGLIVETKGPVGLIIPITFIISIKLNYKEKFLNNIHQYLGIILFLVIGTAWYITIILKNESLLDYFLNHQIVDRVSGNSFQRKEPFWYYIVFVPLLGIPLFFIPFISNFRKRFFNNFRQNNEIKSLTISFLIFLIILSFSSSKLILYALPLYSLISLIIAHQFYQIAKKWITIFINFYYALFLLISISLIILFFYPFNLYFQFLHSFLVLIFTTVILIILAKNKYISVYFKLLTIANIFIFNIIVNANLFFNSNELKINSVKPIAEFINENSEISNRKIIVFDQLIPSISFYLNQPIITVNNGRYTTEREIYFEKNDSWKEYLINYKIKSERDKLIKLNDKNNLFLIVRTNSIKPDTIVYLQNKLGKSKVFEKYTVYY